MNIKYLSLICCLTISLPGWSVFAEEQVYGRDLMTEQEFKEHKARMRSFESETERDKYRYEHHKKMQQRAKQQGVTLPDTPQSGGKGMGTGGGQGGGKGGGRY